MNQSFQNIFIESIAACVPKGKISGTHFEDSIEGKELRKFERTTGILERRYVDENTMASDLGFVAAQKILREQKCGSEVKALIFLSQTSDYKIPFTSNILQDKLGLSKEILCLDINAGCAGFVQGLSVAYSIANTIKGKVLFVVAETLSKILSPKDRSTNLLFGDGAAALLIGANENLTGVTQFNFFSDGNNYDAIIIPEGGYRKTFDENSLRWNEDENGNLKQGMHLHMDGPRVFDFTLREIPESITKLVSEYNLNLNNIDAFLFHQSNKFIIRQIASKLKLDKNKVPLNIDRFGNTSGVSIPLLWVTESNSLKSKSKLLLSGYGSGLNWGNCMMTLSPNLKTYDLLEY